MEGSIEEGILYGGAFPRVPHQPLIKLMCDACQNKPDSIFLVDGGNGRSYTYGELYERSRKLAVCLAKKDVGPGSVVSFCSEPNMEYFSFCLATWIAGATTHPLDPNFKVDELRILVENSRAKLIYCGRNHVQTVSRLSRVLRWPVPIVYGKRGLLDWDEEVDPLSFTLPQVDPTNHVMTIVFSSGTTGMPKGVKLRDQALNKMSNIFENDTKGLDRIFVTGLIFWTSFNILTAFSIKNTKTIIIPGDIFDYENVRQTIADYKPNFWLAPPHVLLSMCQLLTSSEEETRSLAEVQSTGMTLSATQKRYINQRVFGGRIKVKHWYATSEVGNITCWPSLPDADSTIYESVGKLVKGVQLKIVDINTNKALGPKEEGEIWVKTETMMAGYLIGQEINISHFDEEGWCHTGDIGYYDENHYIYFVSRQRDIIRYLWLKISPYELESILKEHSDVKECCVVRKPHPTDGEQPAAFVVKKEGSTVTDTELQEFLQEKVAETKKLRGGIYFVDSIPKGSTGKVLRKTLEQHLVNEVRDEYLI